MKDISILQKRIGYSFKNKELLIEALTHSSYMFEAKIKVCNERLEFLGDSILSVVVSEFLFTRFKNFPEGELTKTRARLVCEESLYSFAKSIELGTYLRFSRGELRAGGAKRSSTLADAFEALIAAIYLDSNIDSAKRFIISFVEPFLEESLVSQDYKSLLQEQMQRDNIRIRYEVRDESGPDHMKVFTVEVLLDGAASGTGVGSSIKNAEQQAAKQALENIG